MSHYVYHRIATFIRYVKGEAIVRRNGNIIRSRNAHTIFDVPRPLQSVSPESGKIKVSGCVQRELRIKPKWAILVRRNGELIHKEERIRDLLVWRGQSIFCNLLSQGAVGTATDTWYAVASENSTAPDMGDDSGDPDANEFNPLIGTPVAVTYTFEPDVKPSGLYQTIAVLTIKGTVISDGSKTLRKIGIRDSVAIPNRHIIVEDSLVPFDVILNDEIEVRYTVQFG